MTIRNDPLDMNPPRWAVKSYGKPGQRWVVLGCGHRLYVGAGPCSGTFSCEVCNSERVECQPAEGGR